MVAGQQNRVLNVAEKNDVAKGIAEILSNGRFNRRESFSKFNKIYEFDLNLNLFGLHQLNMTVTSVSGHLSNYDFAGDGRSMSWEHFPIGRLFEAPIEKTVTEYAKNIKRTLENEAKKCDFLIIWTDCDREGENIGFEIIDVCRKSNRCLNIYRARFSEITRVAINNAIRNLVAPNQRISDAVECRQELDLRIGAAFTRFQTLLGRKKFPEKLANMLISYGPCQFPTLGFVVERYKQNKNFVAEPFWKIVVEHQKPRSDSDNQSDLIKIEFNWSRVKLFDKHACEIFHLICQENPRACVENVVKKPKSKRRPVGLETISLEKVASKKLRLSARRTMDIAQKLYTKGYISYPRTETNKFPANLNLNPLVNMQIADGRWGTFAQRVIDRGPHPHQGTKSDEAHPPIHPLRYVPPMELQNDDERKVYEYVVRHFLACLSDDARGFETLVHIDVAGEKFTASGLIITERNYLEVYTYEKWSDKELPDYVVGEIFQPTAINMVEGKTNAPPLLTEADLIALMDKHGIGTDATHAEHIEKIKDRKYVALNQSDRFVPGFLGLGLVEGYDSMGYAMSKPNLRAELERALVEICEAYREAERLVAALDVYFGGNNTAVRATADLGDVNFPRLGRHSDDDDDNDDFRPFGGANNRGAINSDNHIHSPLGESSQQNIHRQDDPATAIEIDRRFLCYCGEEPIAGPNCGRKFYRCGRDRESACNFFLWSNKPREDFENIGQSNQNFSGQNTRGRGRRRGGAGSAQSSRNIGDEFFPVSVKWSAASGAKSRGGGSSGGRKKFKPNFGEKNSSKKFDWNVKGDGQVEYNAGGGSRRKCSVCRQAGHFANRCPRNL
uniref:DNA topoisomerase n=1 Tax=Romanomermis culicivorax TaxID=13658 RepID=A0A915IA97_ROMCU